MVMQLEAADGLIVTAAAQSLRHHHVFEERKFAFKTVVFGPPAHQSLTIEPNVKNVYVHYAFMRLRNRGRQWPVPQNSAHTPSAAAAALLISPIHERTLAAAEGMAGRGGSGMAGGAHAPELSGTRCKTGSIDRWCRHSRRRRRRGGIGMPTSRLLLLLLLPRVYLTMNRVSQSAVRLAGGSNEICAK